MKMHRYGVAVAIAIGSMVAFASITQAQDNKETKPPTEKKELKPDLKPGAPPTIGPARDRFNQYASYLNLTEEQKPKVKPILDERTTKINELRQDTKLTPEERRTKSRELQEATSAKLKPILTAEQWEKWQRTMSGPRTVPTPAKEVGAPTGAPAAPAPTK